MTRFFLPLIAGLAGAGLAVSLTATNADAGPFTSRTETVREIYVPNTGRATCPNLPAQRQVKARQTTVVHTVGNSTQTINVQEPFCW